jgi:hypothetical protein
MSAGVVGKILKVAYEVVKKKHGRRERPALGSATAFCGKIRPSAPEEDLGWTVALLSNCW